MNRRILATTLILLATGMASPAAWADNTGRYVVVVDYTAEPAQFAALRASIEGVAKASITEPGCRRFDVVAPADKPDHLTLYEVFDDRAAFEAHAATPHFKQFVIDSTALHATRTAVPGTVVLSLQKP